MARLDGSPARRGRAAGDGARWIDLYVLRPARRADEIFHRTIAELLQESARLQGEGPSGATVVGDPRSPRAHELRTTLAGLGIPHRVREPDAGSRV
ncbi:MAG: hypothetical protein H0U07_03840 [Actinobacteria bacterium]|nr:hypothetical protein [Actinomycetota bacterium]